MTAIDRFLSFTRDLPADRLAAVEQGLAALMESYSDSHAFTAGETAEIDRRLAEPKPEFASVQEVEALFGRPFSA